MILNISNPATGLQISEIEVDTIQTINDKYNKLRAGQKVWATNSISQRKAILGKFAQLLKQNELQLAEILTAEVGKPLQQSINEINGGINRINWILENGPNYLADETMSSNNGMTEEIIYEPLGVVCNISAWNYPYLVGINVIIPALLAGNAVIYKPSEYATLTGLQIKKLLFEAGIADDYFEIVVGKGNTGASLLELPFDGYYFTGSYNTGQYIYEKVAKKMVPCQLELGGKDPLYVAEDVVDIKNVAIGTADGAFYNNGQSCCAVERIYAHANVYDSYVQHFVAEVKTWKIGLPTTQGVYIGALTRGAQIEVIEKSGS